MFVRTCRPSTSTSHCCRCLCVRLVNTDATTSSAAVSESNRSSASANQSDSKETTSSSRFETDTKKLRSLVGLVKGRMMHQHSIKYRTATNGVLQPNMTFTPATYLNVDDSFAFLPGRYFERFAVRAKPERLSTLRFDQQPKSRRKLPRVSKSDSLLAAHLAREELLEAEIGRSRHTDQALVTFFRLLVDAMKVVSPQKYDAAVQSFVRALFQICDHRYYAQRQQRVAAELNEQRHQSVLSSPRLINLLIQTLTDHIVTRYSVSNSTATNDSYWNYDVVLNHTETLQRLYEWVLHCPDLIDSSTISHWLRLAAVSHECATVQQQSHGDIGKHEPFTRLAQICRLFAEQSIESMNARGITVTVDNLTSQQLFSPVDRNRIRQQFNQLSIDSKTSVTDNDQPSSPHEYHNQLCLPLNQPITRPSPEHFNTFDKSDLHECTRAQLDMEASGGVAVQPVVTLGHHQPEVQTRARKKIDKLRERWTSELHEAFMAQVWNMFEKNDLLATSAVGRKGTILTPSDRQHLMLYLALLPVHEYVDVMCQMAVELMSTQMPTPVEQSRYEVSTKLARKVVSRWLRSQQSFRNFQQVMEEVCARYHQLFYRPDVAEEFNINHRVLWNAVCDELAGVRAEHLLDPTFEPRAWTYLDKLGDFLTDLMVDTITIGSRKRKAFDVIHRLPTKSSGAASYMGKPALIYKQKPPLLANQAAAQLFNQAGMNQLHYDVTELPMIAPPMPWVHTRTGGYYTRQSLLVRTGGHGAGQYRKWLGPGMVESRIRSSDQLTAIFDSLNQLGSIAWRVNRPMLDTQIQAFTAVSAHTPTCEQQAIRHVKHRIKLPEPSTFHAGLNPLDTPDAPQSNTSADADPVDQRTLNRHFRQWYKQRQLARQREYDKHGLWATLLYRLSIAWHFRDRKLWLPHNMDFRGRVYPISPYLNHMGDDLSRSLLQFAIGKPLGNDGLYWMKQHLVNLTGLMKKSTVAERLQFADESMSAILDSADKPLEGDLDRKFWINSDEPWQTLSVCREIANAVRSGNPSTYVSHLPVHQDGSCNGYQHYAALGRDVDGAFNVNLTPCDRPQDVYEQIRQIVHKYVQRDLHDTTNLAKQQQAERAAPFVTRKMVKRPVMTIVYGVTRYGAGDQVAQVVKEQLESTNDTMHFGDVMRISQYLANLVLEAVSESFAASRKIMAWFLTCTEHITGKHIRRSVQWETPLGLPVYQPYMNVKEIQLPVERAVDGLDTYMRVELPIPQKQKHAMPPNYVHSLDSTHMMMTSLHCQHAGITFASVHDCFWTHACDVHVMNRITRQQFVALHKLPLLQELRASFVRTYLDTDVFRNQVSAAHQKRIRSDIDDLPNTGEFDIDSVLESTYFFS